MKKKPNPEVEVQITPMLDMAFQLLTFFILTYHPAPTEGQFALNLLPAQAVTNPDDKPADAHAHPTTDPPPALKTVTTTLRANADGNLASVVDGRERRPLERDWRAVGQAAQEQGRPSPSTRR